MVRSPPRPRPRLVAAGHQPADQKAGGTVRFDSGATHLAWRGTHRHRFDARPPRRGHRRSLERAAREVEDYRHHRFDHLHLVAPPSICSTIAARTVVKLSMFTDIELSLIQMEPPEAIGLISQGKADAAAVFRYSSIPNFLHIGDDLTSIRWVTIRCDCWCAAPAASPNDSRRPANLCRCPPPKTSIGSPAAPPAAQIGETGHPCRIQAGYPPLHG